MEDKEKKEENKKIEKIEINSEEELMKLLEELANDKNKKTIVVQGLNMKLVKNEFLNFLCYWLINALLIAGSISVFRPLDSSSLWYLPVLFTVFTVLDYGMKMILYRYFQKWIIMSGGTITIIPTIIALVASFVLIYFVFGVRINNWWLLVGSIATFMVVRMIFVNIIRRKNLF